MNLRNENKVEVASVVKLSLEGLRNLYDQEQGLFAFYIKGGRKFSTPLSWSICYTAIALLGLQKARLSTWREVIAIDLERTLEALNASWENAGRLGHLGLIQWANAECGGRYIKKLVDKIASESSRDNLLKVPTTELAWLLTGICAAYRNLQTDDLLKDLALHYFMVLTDSFNPRTGLFRHTPRRAGRLDLRSHIGNFADQIYAVFALSLFYEVFKDERALRQAVQCADRLCSLQGEYGQWWWHYHSERGTVSSPYPVFSVHQDGMAPMSLQKLSAVSGKDYGASIEKGLKWLFGYNELGFEMVDWGRNLIWRDVEPFSFLTPLGRYVSILMMETGLASSMAQARFMSALGVNREMRSYELGWLLYAYAGTPESQDHYHERMAGRQTLK